MAELIKMPRLSDTMEEGTVATWFKKVGDKVEAGELIANSGISGGQQISALYFSIRKNGRPQNPRQWLIR